MLRGHLGSLVERLMPKILVLAPSVAHAKSLRGPRVGCYDCRYGQLHCQPRERRDLVNVGGSRRERRVARKQCMLISWSTGVRTLDVGLRIRTSCLLRGPRRTEPKRFVWDARFVLSAWATPWTIALSSASGE